MKKERKTRVMLGLAASLFVVTTYLALHHTEHRHARRRKLRQTTWFETMEDNFRTNIKDMWGAENSPPAYANPDDDFDSKFQMQGIVAPLHEHAHAGASDEHDHTGHKHASAANRHHPTHAIKDFTLRVFVFGFLRLLSLQRLCTSLKRARYDGRRIPLTMVVDGEGSPAVVKFVKEFDWPFGPKEVVVHPTRHGLQRTIMHAWHPTDMNEFAVFFEDDIELSPFWYQWTIRLIEKYVLNQLVDPLLAGFSLYTPRLNQIAYPFVHWEPEYAVPEGQPYRHQLPCSWGGVYFPWVWAQFHEYYARRTYEGMEHMIFVPNSRSNVWTRSWKRYLIEFMYARGQYMVYPNFPEQQSLSTTHKEPGEHTGKVGKAVSVKERLLEPWEKDPEYWVPLVQNGTLVAEARLPELHEMAIVDLHHQRRNSEFELMQEGFAWAEKAVQRSDNRALFTAMFDALVNIVPGCALDQLSPASDAAALAGRGGRRYLMYQPQNGFSNQRDAFVDAILIAKVLNRTLVVPSIQGENGEGNYVLHYSDVFDATSLSVLLEDSVSIEDFVKAGLQPDRVVAVEGNVRYIPPNNRFFKSYGISLNVPQIPLFINRLSDRDFQRLFGNCNDQVLAFNNIYNTFSVFEDKDKDAAMREELQNFMSPSAEVARLLYKIESNLGNYHCLHLRRGDFMSYCEFLNEESLQEGHEGWLDNFHFKRCYPDYETVRKNMQEHHFKKGDRVYVTTDEKDLKTLYKELGGYDVRTLEMFKPWLHAIDDELIPWLEQLVCSRAERFIGNRYSTFTRSIVRERNYRDADSNYFRQPTPPAGPPTVVKKTVVKKVYVKKVG